MSTHSRLSPSASHRWLNCTASVAMSDGMTNKSSTTADEGTLAHRVLELQLAKFLTETYHFNLVSKHSYAVGMLAVKDSALYSEVMIEHAEEAGAYISNSIDAFLHFASLEMSIPMPFLGEGSKGTADVVLVIGNELHVFDYKYGQNVLVSAEDNSQFMLYAYSAFATLSSMYDIDTIHVHVMQPRMDNWAFQSFTPRELERWIFTDVEPSVSAIETGETELKRGEWCQFCPAKVTCRAYAEETLKLLHGSFDEPNTLTNEELVRLFKDSKKIKSYLEALNEYLFITLSSGAKIDGLKLVNGRGSRSFTDIQEVEATLRELPNGDEFFETKMLSLTGIEAKLKTRQFNILFSHLLEIKKGAPTVVLKDDERNEISKTDLLNCFD